MKDPGAYMNRTTLESDPHSVIEGLLISGYAVGEKQGDIYVRNEYPRAVAKLNHHALIIMSCVLSSHRSIL